jgi:hypothetical protein
MAPAFISDSAEIRADAAYPLPDFMARTGLGRKGLATARTNGLVTKRCGRRTYVVGQSWLDYLNNHARSV